MQQPHCQDTMGEYRLSLVAQFDDIVRNSAVLTTGIETEFWRFVQSQEEARAECAVSLSDVKELRRQQKTLEQENTTLLTKLKHARSQIDIEMKRRRQAEQDRETLERQIVLVRELLMDRNNQTMLKESDRERLAFLSSDFQTSNVQSPAVLNRNLSVIEESMSLLSDADISYDKTGDDLDTSALRSGRKYKRPSAPPQEEDEDLTTPEKKNRHSRSYERKQRKHRRSKSATTITGTTVTLEMGMDGFDATAEISTTNSAAGKHHRTRSGGKLKKHHSAKDIKELNRENQASDDSYNGQRTPQGHIQGYDTPESPHLRSYSSTGKGLINRPHIFVSKNVLRLESCNPCGKRIRFGKSAMKCKDCQAIAHRECKDLVPLPCIPSSATPGTAKSHALMIADYAPNDPPMIPALVIHCVNEVEARGLSEAGIYRVSGSEREVKKLKVKFLRGKGTPNLSHVDDIHVVCGCLKDFLRNLKEPLVTFRLWNHFFQAAVLEDIDESIKQLFQAISELPQPNRDTLAFMILHLQRVFESEDCKMGVSNLSKVLGPTLVGYSSADPEPMQIMSETGKQPKVLERLISISSDYWTNFITIDADENIPPEQMTPQTPEARPIPHSMLGPVSVSGELNASDKIGWFTPKFGSKSRQITKKSDHFFNSPSLK